MPSALVSMRRNCLCAPLCPRAAWPAQGQPLSRPRGKGRGRGEPCLEGGQTPSHSWLDCSLEEKTPAPPWGAAPGVLLGRIMWVWLNPLGTKNVQETQLRGRTFTPVPLAEVWLFLANLQETSAFSRGQYREDPVLLSCPHSLLPCASFPPSCFLPPSLLSSAGTGVWVISGARGAAGTLHSALTALGQRTPAPAPPSQTSVLRTCWKRSARPVLPVSRV